MEASGGINIQWAPLARASPVAAQRSEQRRGGFCSDLPPRSWLLILGWDSSVLCSLLLCQEMAQGKGSLAVLPHMLFQRRGGESSTWTALALGPLFLCILLLERPVVAFRKSSYAPRVSTGGFLICLLYLTGFLSLLRFVQLWQSKVVYKLVWQGVPLFCLLLNVTHLLGWHKIMFFKKGNESSWKVLTINGYLFKNSQVQSLFMLVGFV